MDLSHLASQPAESPRHSESPVAELPEGWVVKFDPRTNRRYYENRETRSTQWQHPCDVPDSVPPDYWQRATDSDQVKVLWRHLSHLTDLSTTYAPYTHLSDIALDYLDPTQEIQMLSKFRHPNIVTLIGWGLSSIDIDIDIDIDIN